MAKDHLSRKLAVILHADVVGSTSLVQKNEALAHERIQATFHQFSETISSYGGVTHELRGDALVAEFDRASDAVAAALAFQILNGELNSTIDDDIQPRLRIGISLGEVIIADNTITGAGVVLAQRLEQLAEPGGVVVQGAISETVPTRMPFEFQSLGEQVLKGFDQPVRAFAGRLRPGNELPTPEADTTPKTAISTDLPVLDKPSIAVLPFTNMSGDPEQEYLADGITEDLITALSRMRSFMVISRNSTFTYKGKPVDAKQIASDLGVRYVLEGSVRKAGNRVRITAQLIDADSDYHVWAEKYDREMEDIFDLQDDMTRTIVGILEPELDAVERKLAINKPSENLDAWASYQRGLWHMWNLEKEDAQEALRLLQRAIELDPTFSTAHAYLSYTHYENVIMGWTDDPEQSLEEGLSAAKQALSLDDKDYVAYFALGRILMMRSEHDASIRALEKSISLNPSFAKGHYALGMVLMLAGRLDEAKTAVEQVERLSPRDPMLWTAAACHACTDILSDDREAALHWAQKALEFHNAKGFWPPVMLAAAYAGLDRLEEARKEVTAALKELPDLTVSYMKKTLPTKHEGALEPLLAALRKAGLPE